MEAPKIQIAIFFSNRAISSFREKPWLRCHGNFYVSFTCKNDPDPLYRLKYPEKVFVGFFCLFFEVALRIYPIFYRVLEDRQSSALFEPDSFYEMFFKPGFLGFSGNFGILGLFLQNGSFLQIFCMIVEEKDAHFLCWWFLWTNTYYCFIGSKVSVYLRLLAFSQKWL